MEYLDADLTKIYDANDDSFPLGAIVKNKAGNKTYQFVEYSQGSNAVVGVAGSLVYWLFSGTSTAKPYTVSKDRASTTTLISSYGGACGQLMAALTDGKRGFIQKGGLSDLACPTDNTVGVGEQIGAADVNGQVKGVPAGTAITPFLGRGAKTDGGSGNSVAAGGILWEIPY